MFQKVGLMKLVLSPAQTECKTAYKLNVSIYGKGEPNSLIYSRQVCQLHDSEMNSKVQTGLKMVSAIVEPRSLKEVQILKH